MGAVMCGINPIMGMINTAMTNWLNAMGGTSKVLLGAIVAGMMSIDMGGPFNKAAYVFGTAALASGNYEVMAAVMVGGMVPPIAIALSTTFCPRSGLPTSAATASSTTSWASASSPRALSLTLPLTRCASCPAASSARPSPVRCP